MARRGYSLVRSAVSTPADFAVGDLGATNTGATVTLSGVETDDLVELDYASNILEDVAGARGIQLQFSEDGTTFGAAVEFGVGTTSERPGVGLTAVRSPAAAAGLSTYTMTALRTTAGTITLFDQSLRVNHYKRLSAGETNVAMGSGDSAENLNQGTLAGGGSVLDQRGTVQPVRPYR